MLAPVAWAAGALAWPALRCANALFGAVAIRCVHDAAREVADRQTAFAVAALFGCCDILLFAIGTARNDALPAACLAGATWLAIRPATRNRALLVGFVRAGAAAAKLSYALPAAAYGAMALLNRERRPAAVLAGVLPIAALVAWAVHFAPENARFDTLTFPSVAPAEFYAGSAKLTVAGRVLDSLKFLALGPALLAVVVVARRRKTDWLDLLIVAGALAALLPAPTWRQYWLPMLPPLFVRLAQIWEEHPPTTAVRTLAALFALVGVTPSLVGAAQGPGLLTATRESRAIRAALDRARETGLVATLSPEFLPAAYRLPDPRFATGPFYFRSHHLLDTPAESRASLVSEDRLATGLAIRPEAVLVGGEGRWTGGDPALDAVLERWAVAHGYRAVPVASTRFRLYLDPRAQAATGIPRFVATRRP